MVEKIDYRGVVVLGTSIPEAEQRELIAAYEPSEIYTIGRDATLDDVIMQQRPPKAVVVSDAALLAEQRGGPQARFDSFLWFKGQLHRAPHFGFFTEARTGRQSNKPKDWPPLRRDAKRMCSRFAQGRKSAFNAKKGAKPWNPTPAGRAMCREEWFSKRNATIDDAVTAIKKRWDKKVHGKKAPGRTVLYREFGSPYAKSKR